MKIGEIYTDASFRNVGRCRATWAAVFVQPGSYFVRSGWLNRCPCSVSAEIQAVIKAFEFAQRSPDQFYADIWIVTDCKTVSQALGGNLESLEQNNWRHPSGKLSRIAPQFQALLAAKRQLQSLGFQIASRRVPGHEANPIFPYNTIAHRECKRLLASKPKRK